MEENCKVPFPINFNCWKHHTGFIIKQIKSVSEIKELEELKSYLLKIGESQMDLYFGDYSPTEVSDQILNLLGRKKIFSLEQYKDWLVKNRKGYQLLKLIDKSVWTLRLGENTERYIHLHPGRHSPQTVRVKATTLKTAILCLCLVNAGQTETIETVTINEIRKKYLNEPPIKSFISASGLGRMISLFSKKL
jgi:hypothetical protein